jgi:hypothetical protein
MEFKMLQTAGLVSHPVEEVVTMLVVVVMVVLQRRWDQQKLRLLLDLAREPKN